MTWIGKWLPLFRFAGSADYWRKRYRWGGDSGAGSTGPAAAYKAQVLNGFVRRYGVRNVVEFGCGDGRQLQLAEYPQYLGLDISPEAIALCRSRFSDDSSKRFELVGDYRGDVFDLALSLDVLFHLVEDNVYDDYLRRLFSVAQRYVVVYATSSAVVKGTLSHVRHRPVEHDIRERFPGFMRMLEAEANLPGPVEHGEGGFTRFFLYRREGGMDESDSH